MPRKSYLDIEKAKIDILKKNMLSNRKIAKEINISEHVIRNYLKLGPKYGIKLKTKGNEKLSSRTICKVTHDATRNRLSSRQIKANLDLPVTNRRIQQVLSSATYIRWRKSIKKPALKPHHKHARLAFARKYMNIGEKWKRLNRC